MCQYRNSIAIKTYGLIQIRVWRYRFDKMKALLTCSSTPHSRPYHQGRSNECVALHSATAKFHTNLSEFEAMRSHGEDFKFLDLIVMTQVIKARNNLELSV